MQNIQWLSKQMAQTPLYVVKWGFEDSLAQSKSAARPWPPRLTFTAIFILKMIYCKILYLKGNQKYSRMKLKLQNILNENRNFSFDLSYFWCPLNDTVMQYLILIVRLVVNLSIECQGIAALLSCAKPSSKTQFYYILRGLYHLFW